MAVVLLRRGHVGQAGQSGMSRHELQEHAERSKKPRRAPICDEVADNLRKLAAALFPQLRVAGRGIFGMALEGRGTIRTILGVLRSSLQFF